MNTTEFERRLRLYLAVVNQEPTDFEAAELAAYEALTEAAGLLGVSMLTREDVK